VIAGFARQDRLDDEDLAFIERHFDSEFRKFQAEFSGEFEALLRFRDADVKGLGRHVAFSQISSALSFAGLGRMKDLLRNHVAPWFFDNYPDGRIAVVRHDYAPFRLSAVVRGTYTMAENSFEDLLDGGRRDARRFRQGVRRRPPEHPH
jgi:hypothetical protein